MTAVADGADDDVIIAGFPIPLMVIMMQLLMSLFATMRIDDVESLRAEGVEYPIFVGSSSLGHGSPSAFHSLLSIVSSIVWTPPCVQGLKRN